MRRRVDLAPRPRAAPRRGRASPSARSCSTSGSDMFCGDRHRQHQAVPLAVFGREEHAARRWRRAGVRGANGCAARASSCPPSAGVTPKIVCISSVRPEPTRPAKPRISPRRAVKRRRAGAPGTSRSRHLQHGSPAGARVPRREVVAAQLAPDHQRHDLVVRRPRARAGRPT